MKKGLIVALVATLAVVFVGVALFLLYKQYKKKSSRADVFNEDNANFRASLQRMKSRLDASIQFAKAIGVQGFPTSHNEVTWSDYALMMIAAKAMTDANMLQDEESRALANTLIVLSGEREYANIQAALAGVLAVVGNKVEQAYKARSSNPTPAEIQDASELLGSHKFDSDGPVDVGRVVGLSTRAVSKSISLYTKIAKAIKFYEKAAKAAKAAKAVEEAAKAGEIASEAAKVAKAEKAMTSTAKTFGAVAEGVNFIGAATSLATAIMAGDTGGIIEGAVDVAAATASSLTFAAEATAAEEGTALATAGAMGAAASVVLAPAAAAIGVIQVGGMIADAIAKHCPCDFPKHEVNGGIPICYKGSCSQEYGAKYVNEGDAACGINCRDTYGSCYYSNGTWCANRGIARCWSKSPGHDLHKKWRKTHRVMTHKSHCEWSTRACQQGYLGMCTALPDTPVTVTYSDWKRSGSLGDWTVA